MSPDRYRQVELVHQDTHMVCWVPDRPDLKRSVQLTLKDLPDLIWDVLWVSEMVVHTEQRRTWRVGGVYDR